MMIVHVDIDFYSSLWYYNYY